MEDVLVSIICVTYNHEKYIRKAIEGFLNQKTNFKYEIIIHDDASTDGTQEIIKEYIEKYPDIIVPILQTENRYSKEPDSIFASYIMPRVRGKYMAFCEGDDYWTNETKLQQQVDILEADSSRSICVHKVQCVNEDDSLNDRIIPEEYYKISETCEINSERFANMIWLTKGYPFHTSSYMIKKEAFDSNCNLWLKLGALLNGDQMYIRIAFLSGKAYYINSEMSCRRLMSIGNWNSRISKLSVKERIELNKKHINGELLFNKLTDGKYQKYIKIGVLKNVMNWAVYDPYEAKRIILENNISFKELKGKLTFKQYIKYFMFMYTPKITQLINGI